MTHSTPLSSNGAPAVVSSDLRSTARPTPIPRPGLFPAMLAGLLCVSGLTSYAADGSWSRQFMNPYLNGTVNAVAASGDTVYFAGEFTMGSATTVELGGVGLDRVFMSTPAGIFPLGDGLDGDVNAIAVDGQNVYVGGEFTTAGGVTVNRIAMWNGTEWSDLDGGVSGGNVNAIAIHDGDVYVGGAFTNAGSGEGITVNRIVRWNGAEWSSLGTGANATVLALASDGEALFAGGGFTQIDGVAASRIARWNGSEWSPLGTGLSSGRVDALAVNAGALHVGGTFTVIGGIAASRIALWNGAAWSALGAGVGAGSTDTVKAIAFLNGELHVGGSFESAGGQPANGIAKWTGAAWETLGNGVVNSFGGSFSTRGTVNGLAVADGKLQVAGAFNRAGTVSTVNTASWNGTEWSAVGQALSTIAYAVERIGDEVLVGGQFQMAGGRTVNAIARWTGVDWSVLGGGVMAGATWGQVHAIAVRGDDVYIGGAFTDAGGVEALNVAHWNGVEWAALGDGIGVGNEFVRALAIDAEGNVYAGGFFSTAGGQPAKHVAMWDGASWTPLGAGIEPGGGGEVRTLAILGDDLYVGGAFNTAGDVETTGIARWDGAAWSDVAGGVNSSVLTLAAADNHLYVGGLFSEAGGAPANRVARWDGAAWSALGDGIGTDEAEYVNALAVDGTTLYAGGDFDSTGAGTPVNNIAVWNGTEWSALGGGLGTAGSAVVSDLLAFGGSVYAAGSFLNADGFPSPGFAIWNAAAAPELRITISLTPDGKPLLSWTGLAGGTYSVLAADSLETPFASIADEIAGTGEELNFVDETATTDLRFYLIEQTLP